MKYTKKPVTIEAVQWTGHNHAEIREFAGPSILKFNHEDGLQLKTLEGSLHASVGDYIIKGVHGEFYPCKPDIFEETYSPAKTVGEMFRELGYIYKRNKSSYSTGLYYDADGEKCEMIISAANVVKKSCIVYDGSGKVVDWPLDYGEIRAVCKLLDEMGVE